jgi:hypothetical protein
MRVLHLYCHPLATSFHGAIRARVTAGLAAGGHAVDLLDLYALGFDPVRSAEGRAAYHDEARNRAGGSSPSSSGCNGRRPWWCSFPPAASDRPPC